jgi:hypothetical protein
MLTTAEAALLLRLRPDRRDAVVLDWRDLERPAAWKVILRAWAASGFVLQPLSDFPFAPPELLDRLDGQGPIVLIGPTPPSEHLLTSLSALPGTVVVTDRDGELLRGVRPLTEWPPLENRTGTTTVEVLGRSPRVLLRCDLPLTLRVRPADTPARSLVRVSAANPFDPPPSPRWFRLRGRGVVDLTVDATVNEDGDAWRLLVNGEPAEPAPDPALGGPGPGLRRLGLVFDRTCPSCTGWADARQLVIDPRGQRVDESDYLRTDGAASLSAPDFNQAVRDGLADALRSLPDAESLPIHLAWFADGNEKGVASLPGVDMPLTLSGDMGTRLAGEAADLLRRLSYCPGLDLWDPLQDALAVVAEPILRHPQAGSGVLIVGNSPPDLPLKATSPFWDLLDFRDLGTTARRHDRRFTDLMRRLDHDGVPVVYLFLTHDRAVGGESKDFDLYQSLQAQVQRTLSGYLPVVPAAADEAGIARGLRDALAYLADPPPSGVVVEPGDET